MRVCPELEAGLLRPEELLPYTDSLAGWEGALAGRKEGVLSNHSPGWQSDGRGTIFYRVFRNIKPAPALSSGCQLLSTFWTLVTSEYGQCQGLWPPSVLLVYFRSQCPLGLQSHSLLLRPGMSCLSFKVQIK